MIIALILLSAFLHATWNALLRLEGDKDRALIAAIAMAAMFAAGVAGVRWGLGDQPFASLGGLGLTVLAGVFEAAYFATLARAMDRGRLGLVYTISRGGAVLAVWPLSIAVFDEAATPSAMAGSAIVLGGLVACGWGRGGGVQGAGAVGWAIACALSIAGYHLAYKAALAAGTSPSACFAVALAVSVALNLARVGAQGRGGLSALVRARGPRLVAMGVVCGGSFLLLLEALAIGGSGYVLTLRNTSVLFAAGLAWSIGERPSRLELGGAMMVAAGAAVMSR